MPATIWRDNHPTKRGQITILIAAHNSPRLSRYSELTQEEKDYNRGLGSFRVAVEHRVGRAKRFRIVSERFRNPRETHHTKTSIVGGLVNLQARFAPC